MIELFEQSIPIEPITHLLTALDDSLFLECFDTENFTVDYFQYRNIVDKK